MSKRTLEMNRRRDRILDAARKLISNEGYGHLTMRALAEAADITVPTIYNLIGNKDAVVGAAIHEGTERFFESAGSSADPVAILEKNVAELLRQSAYYRPLLRALLHGEAREAMAEIDALYLEHLHESIEGLKERGDLEPWVDSGILAERMLSNFFGAASEWASSVLSDAALPTATSYDANITLAGVATDKGRSRFQSRARKLQKGAIESERGRLRARELRSTGVRR
ncbi:MAG: TetR/AcrR family transcriptional regulator [Myxococcales bacterium]|nr:TetR/AcrR family transcriptional regulator [Myxococcales bacterium]